MIKALFYTILLSLISGITAACQTTGNEGSDLATLKAIVYGQVMTEKSVAVNRAKVILAQYPEGCDIDTLFTALEHEFTDRSGKYRIVYHIGGMEEESCFQASIKLSDKELISKTFQVDFRLNSPFDSVRIDFVLQDLKKRKE